MQGTTNTLNNYLPGSIGTVSYYPEPETSFTDSITASMDSALLKEIFNFKKADFDEYQGKLNAYNGKKDTYNKAAKDETARRGDLFKAMFEAPIEIPKRPCPPTQPRDYSFVKFSLEKILKSGYTLPTTATLFKATANDNYAVLEYNTKTVPTPTYQIGYLPTLTDGATATSVDKTGHALGRLGYGKASGYESSPFSFAAQLATKTAGF